MRLRVAAALAVGAVLTVPNAVTASSANGVAPAVSFAYTGSEQSYTVPRGVALVALAAKGGRGGQFAEGGGHEGGVGAMVPVKAGERLFVEVGSAGAYKGGRTFGGGGAAGAPPPVVCMLSNRGGPCADVYASSGGGASDVRTCSISTATCPGGVSSAATRLIVGGGGGGEAGAGNAQSVTCGATDSAGANSFQYLPGNRSLGPVPIVTAAGIVYPGRSTLAPQGTTPAVGGSDVAGTGGSQAGCGAGSVLSSDSVAGSSAVGTSGGTGGNASSLGPMNPTCSVAANTCQDAGPGGGGGGGYFGGGGGATGYDRETGNCGACGSAGSGEGGAGGSSFVSKRMMDPVDESLLLGAPPDGAVVIVPAIEIEAPVSGAVYRSGQVVYARWQCGYDSRTGLGISNCNGSVATGARISTSPGKHTFTVSGTVSSNGNHTIGVTVHYTVR
jgi:hypothetical protein